MPKLTQSPGRYMPFYRTLCMYRYFILFLVAILQDLSPSFGQSTAAAKTETIALFTYNETEFPFLKNCNQATLSNEELLVADTLLQKFIAAYNKEQARQYNLFTPEQQNGHVLLLLDLNNFRRQYVPITNQSGEKEVWVNCFCNSIGKD
jgi:hypothetical protein